MVLLALGGVFGFQSPDDLSSSHISPFLLPDSTSSSPCLGPFLIPWHLNQALEFSSWEPHLLPFVTLSLQLISTRGCLEPLEAYGVNLTCNSSLNKISSSHPSGGFSCQQTNSNLDIRTLFIIRSSGTEGIHVVPVHKTPSSLSLLVPLASHSFSFWPPQDWVYITLQLW